MDTKYKVIIADDSNHEKVFAEMYCDDKFIALINQEKGVNHLAVELPGPDLVESLVMREIVLNDFVALLKHAAQKLVGQS